MAALHTEGLPVKINLTSIMVNDQDRALAFYTGVLGFVKKTEIPVGEYRWLTVVSPEGPPDIELAFEPNNNPVVDSAGFQRALYENGIPATSFGVDDVQQEYERLSALGVRFHQAPVTDGGVMTAIFDDTCGNLIMIAAVA